MLTKDEIIEKVGKIFKPSHMVSYIQQGKDVFANVVLGELALDDIEGDITGSIGIPMVDGSTYLYNIFVTIFVDKDNEAWDVYRTAIYNCGYPFRSEAVEINAFSDRLEWHFYGESKAGVFIVDEVTDLLEDITADAQAAQKYLNEIARNRASKFLRSVNKAQEEMRTKDQILNAVYKATGVKNWYATNRSGGWMFGALMHSYSVLETDIDVSAVIIVPADPMWEITAQVEIVATTDNVAELDLWAEFLKLQSAQGFSNTLYNDDYKSSLVMESEGVFNSGDLEQDIKDAFDNLSKRISALMPELKTRGREMLNDLGG